MTSNSNILQALSLILTGEDISVAVASLCEAEGSRSDRKLRELERAVSSDPSLENIEALRDEMRRYGIPLGPAGDDPSAHVNYYETVVAFDRRSVTQRKGLHFLWTNHGPDGRNSYLSVESAGRGCKAEDLGERISDALRRVQGFASGVIRYHEAHGTKACGKWTFNISAENNLIEDSVREAVRNFSNILNLPVVPSNEQMEYHRVALAAWRRLEAAGEVANNHTEAPRDPHHKNWMTFRALNVGDIFQFSSSLSFATAGSSGSNIVKSGDREYTSPTGRRYTVGSVRARVFLIARGNNA